MPSSSSPSHKAKYDGIAREQRRARCLHRERIVGSCLRLAVVLGTWLVLGGDANASTQLTSGSAAESPLTVAGPLGEPVFAPPSDGAGASAVGASVAGGGLWQSPPVQLLNGVVEGIYGVIADSVSFGIHLGRMAGEGEAIAEQQQAAALTGVTTPVTISRDTEQFVSSVANGVTAVVTDPVATVEGVASSAYDTAAHGTWDARGRLLGGALTLAVPALRWTRGFRTTGGVGTVVDAVKKTAGDVASSIARDPTTLEEAPGDLARGDAARGGPPRSEALAAQSSRSVRAVNAPGNALRRRLWSRRKRAYAPSTPSKPGTGCSPAIPRRTRWLSVASFG